MDNRNSKAYGLHLMLDGYGADSAKLDDIGLLFNTLDSLPTLVGMRKIGFPHLARFTERDIAGISGFVMIMESHISIHTYSKKDFLSLDLYSCRNFDPQVVIDHIRDTYGVREVETHVVSRGKKFPERNLHE